MEKEGSPISIETEEPSQRPPVFWQTLHSVMVAAFGIQGGWNRVRDFSHGRSVYFIILGLLFTLAFVLLLAGIVKLMLSLNGLRSLHRRDGLSLVVDPEHRGSHY